MKQNILVKLDLKLTHFPYSISKINPTSLLNNGLLRDKGQLVKLKLARVVNVFESSMYLRRYSLRSRCQCKNHGEYELVHQQILNPLKLFKNMVNRTTKLGKNLYQDAFEEEEDLFCNYCNIKYEVMNQQYAHCQKIEILVLNKEGKLVNLSQNLSNLWLISPFVDTLVIGDVITLTAYYFMSPQQQIVNEKCVSPFVGQFIAFDIVKVNPFNQMIGKDSMLAQAFYAPITTGLSSTNQSEYKQKVQTSLLTLDNLKIHEQNASQTNVKFIQKVNKINKLANLQKYQTSTNFTGAFSIFDALYEEDQIEKRKDKYEHQQQETINQFRAYTQFLTENYKKQLSDYAIDIDCIEQQFGKVHMLVDKIFENQINLQQNSHMFQLKLSMLISTVIQMKNSLVKYLDYEAKEFEQNYETFTQAIKIENPYKTQQDIDYNIYSIMTPFNEMEEEEKFSMGDSIQRENVHLLIISDDLIYANHLIKIMKRKGTKIVDFPSIYEMNSIIPFLLINDHSIVVIKNPKKDILNIIKLIIKKGIIINNRNQPIKLNITLWVIIDSVILLENVKFKENKARPKIKEIVEKQFGKEFVYLFDITIDISNYSNLEILGTNYLQYQENYMLDKFSLHLDQGHIDLNDEKIYKFKDLKCMCRGSEGGLDSTDIENFSISQDEMSIGEMFIQHYYTYQRLKHKENDYSNQYPEEKFKLLLNNWMSLSDVVRVKKIADDINFLRLFYLKSTQDHLQRSNSKFKRYDGLEIIDCILSIYLFEISRITKHGVSIFTRDQYPFQILQFFAKLKLCKEINSDPDIEAKRVKQTIFTQLMEEEQEGQIFTQMMENLDIKGEKCINCKSQVRSNERFRNLYKKLLDDMFRFN